MVKKSSNVALGLPEPPAKCTMPGPANTAVPSELTWPNITSEIVPIVVEK
jgi:hypothetical protein